MSRSLRELPVCMRESTHWHEGRIQVGKGNTVLWCRMTRSACQAATVNFVVHPDYCSKAYLVVEHVAPRPPGRAKVPLPHNFRTTNMTYYKDIEITVMVNKLV